jgi:hypothetical protein
LLTGALHIVSCLSQGITVLTHCSDGWDRTAQLTSLVQLMLDSHYRTLEGFICLLEKEFLSFGHRWHDRLGHGSFSNEVAPVFLQFLDCVYQLMTQFPTHFQFNVHLLLWLHHHLYAGVFGTWFFNSEEERMRNAAPERTRSAWWYVLTHLVEFVNPVYGVGWNHLAPCVENNGGGATSARGSLGGGAAGGSVASVERHPAFASLPVFNDPTTLLVDVKELRFFSELYLCYKDSSQGLAWNANHVHWAVAALAQGSSSSSSGAPVTIGGALHPGSSNHADPRLDLHPVQWVTECRIKSEKVEELARRLAWAEREEEEHKEALAHARTEAAAEVARIRATAADEMAALREEAAKEQAALKAELQKTREELDKARKPMQAIEHPALRTPSKPAASATSAAERDHHHHGSANTPPVTNGTPHTASGAMQSQQPHPHQAKSSANTLTKLFGEPVAPALVRVPTVLRVRAQYVDSNKCADKDCRQDFTLVGNRPCHCRVCGHAHCKACAQVKHLWVASASGSTSAASSDASPSTSSAGGQSPKQQQPQQQKIIREERVCRECVARITVRAEQELHAQQERQLQTGNGNSPGGSAFSPTTASQAMPVRGGIYLPRSPAMHGSDSAAGGVGVGVGLTAASLPSTVFSLLSAGVTAGVGAAAGATTSLFKPAFSTRATSTPRNTRSMSVTAAGDLNLRRLSGNAQGQSQQEDTSSSSDSADDD